MRHDGRAAASSAPSPSLPPPAPGTRLAQRCPPPCSRPECPQRKIREDPEICNAVAGGIAGEPGRMCSGLGCHLTLGAACSLAQSARCVATLHRSVMRCQPSPAVSALCVTSLRSPPCPRLCNAPGQFAACLQALPPIHQLCFPSCPPPPPPGAITATVVCPLDVLKTRLQVQGKAGAAMYRGVGGEFLIKALHPPPPPAPAAAACQLGAASGAARLAAVSSQYSYEAVAQGEHPAPEPSRSCCAPPPVAAGTGRPPPLPAPAPQRAAGGTGAPLRLPPSTLPRGRHRQSGLEWQAGWRRAAGGLGGIAQRCKPGCNWGRPRPTVAPGSPAVHGPRPPTGGRAAAACRQRCLKGSPSRPPPLPPPRTAGGRPPACHAPPACHFVPAPCSTCLAAAPLCAAACMLHGLPLAGRARLPGPASRPQLARLPRALCSQAASPKSCGRRACAACTAA